MNRLGKITLAILLGTAIAMPTSVVSNNVLDVNAEESEESEAAIMYRVYNPNSGEHFYTANESEKKNLILLGWHDEGIGWFAPFSSNTPVYRLYNANAGDHHYTASADERDTLVKAGWKYEGIGWYSDDSRSIALYRQYNPNARAGAHNYTTSKNENDNLVNVGWRAEGIGWYGVEAWVETKTVITQEAYDETVTVVDKDAYDSYEYVDDYVICNGCGQKFDTVEEWDYHAVLMHGAGDDDHNDYHTTPIYETVHHPAVTHQENVHHDAVTSTVTIVHLGKKSS